MKADADPDDTDDKGQTALMSAASYGHTDTVTALMERGATVNKQAESQDGS